jgi:putative copper export protein
VSGEISRDALLVVADLLRVVTLPAGLLIGGSAGAGALLRGLGAAPDAVDAAARRLVRLLLALLLAAALPIAVVETLWETQHPLDLTLLTDLLPYMLIQTFFGPIWIGQTLILIALLLRLGAGHPPGLCGSLALLVVWPQIGHLTPNYAILDANALLETGWLALHRVGAAFWPGTLAVLLLWIRPGGPADRPWGAAFFRQALPAAALLLAGAAGTIANHGGWVAILGPGAFAALVQVKLALLAALLVLGARHFRAYRRPGPPATRSTLAVEVALALVAVTLGALLGLLPAPGT